MTPHLSSRQIQVVRLTSLGCTTHEVAAILGIAKSTAENHKATAMKVLGTDKAVLLARLAIKHKFSSLNDTLSTAEKRKCGRRNDGWN